MDTEKSVLQQIRDKEQELNAEIDAIRVQCDGKVATARNETAEHFKNAELSAKNAAEEYARQEKAKINVEVEQLKKRSEEVKASVQAAGKNNLKTAGRKIVSVVSSQQ